MKILIIQKSQCELYDALQEMEDFNVSVPETGADIGLRPGCIIFE